MQLIQLLEGPGIKKAPNINLIKPKYLPILSPIYIYIYIY